MDFENKDHLYNRRKKNLIIFYKSTFPELDKFGILIKLDKIKFVILKR